MKKIPHKAANTLPSTPVEENDWLDKLFDKHTIATLHDGLPVKIPNYDLAVVNAFELKAAKDYCGDIQPAYIVPKEMPLKFSKQEYDGFTLTKATKPEEG